MPDYATVSVCDSHEENKRYSHCVIFGTKISWRGFNIVIYKCVANKWNTILIVNIAILWNRFHVIYVLISEFFLGSFSPFLFIFKSDEVLFIYLFWPWWSYLFACWIHLTITQERQHINPTVPLCVRVIVFLHILHL